MKSILFASLMAGTLSLAHFAEAAPHNPQMRHHAPGMEIGKSLRGISLTKAQKTEIEALVDAFKNSHERPEKPEKPSATALLHTSEADIRTQVEANMASQQPQRAALAQLSNAIYALLSDDQKSMLAERDVKHEKMRADKPDRRDSKHQGLQPAFKGIGLTDEQQTAIMALNEEFRANVTQHKLTMDAYREKEQALVQSSNFSVAAWEALHVSYQDAMIDAAVEKLTHMQELLALLTDAQIAQLEQRRDNEKFLNQLFRR